MPSTKTGADSYLTHQIETLPNLLEDLLADELAMAKDNAARSDVIPRDVAYLAAIREEITRRGLTEEGVSAAREERIARRTANMPHTCCAACRRDSAS